MRFQKFLFVLIFTPFMLAMWLGIGIALVFLPIVILIRPDLLETKE